MISDRRPAVHHAVSRVAGGLRSWAPQLPGGAQVACNHGGNLLLSTGCWVSELTRGCCLHTGPANRSSGDVASWSLGVCAGESTAHQRWRDHGHPVVSRARRVEFISDHYQGSVKCSAQCINYVLSQVPIYFTLLWAFWHLSSFNCNLQRPISLATPLFRKGRG